MAELEKLREVDLYALLPVNNVKKGFTYINAILEPVRTGSKLTGNIMDRQRYLVEVDVTPNSIIGSCTCFSYEGQCKHIAALLLKWIRTPEAFTHEGEAEATHQAGATPLRVTPVPPPPTSRPPALPEWMQNSWAEREGIAQKNLETLFNYLRLDDLRAFARDHGWSVKGGRKVDVIQQSMGQLLQPDQVLQILSKLDNEHRQVLWAIALLGVFPSQQLEAMERLAKSWGKLKQHSKFTTYVRHLTEAGLVVSYEQVGQPVYNMGPAAEFGDDYALAEMKAVTSLATVMIAEISPRLVLIPKLAATTLAAELEKAGYTPQQTEETA